MKRPLKKIKTGEDDSALMPIIVGVMTAVIVLLGVVIFFIVSKSRQKQKKWLSAPINEEGSEILTASEKMALSSSSNAYPFNAQQAHPQQQQHFGTVLGTTASSDTGSSGHSSGRMLHILPKLDDNYNTPVHPGVGGNMTPRTTARHHHTTNVTASPFYNNGSSIIRTPSGTRKTFPPVPRLQVPPPPPHPPTDEEAVYTEPGTYTEPYRAVPRYSPYYGYGPVGAEDALMKQALLSGECKLVIC